MDIVLAVGFEPLEDHPKLLLLKRLQYYTVVIGEEKELSTLSPIRLHLLTDLLLVF